MSAVVSMNLAFLGIHANSEGCVGNRFALFVVSSQSKSYISLMDSFFYRVHGLVDFHVVRARTNAFAS